MVRFHVSWNSLCKIYVDMHLNIQAFTHTHFDYAERHPMMLWGASQVSSFWDGGVAMATEEEGKENVI